MSSPEILNPRDLTRRGTEVHLYSHDKPTATWRVLGKYKYQSGSVQLSYIIVASAPNDNFWLFNDIPGPEAVSEAGQIASMKRRITESGGSYKSFDDEARLLSSEENALMQMQWALEEAEKTAVFIRSKLQAQGVQLGNENE